MALEDCGVSGIGGTADDIDVAWAVAVASGERWTLTDDP